MCMLVCPQARERSSNYPTEDKYTTVAATCERNQMPQQLNTENIS